MFLAASVFFAIKDAIKSARVERGITDPFELLSPATVERIRMACTDQFVETVSETIIMNSLQLAICYYFTLGSSSC